MGELKNPTMILPRSRQTLGEEIPVLESRGEEWPLWCDVCGRKIIPNQRFAIVPTRMEKDGKLFELYIHVGDEKCVQELIDRREGRQKWFSLSERSFGQIMSLLTALLKVERLPDEIRYIVKSLKETFDIKADLTQGREWKDWRKDSL